MRMLTTHPFAGSNTSAVVAESLGRRWLAMDQVPEYLHASAFRFEQIPEIDVVLFADSVPTKKRTTKR